MENHQGTAEPTVDEIAATMEAEGFGIGEDVEPSADPAPGDEPLEATEGAGDDAGDVDAAEAKEDKEDAASQADQDKGKRPPGSAREKAKVERLTQQLEAERKRTEEYAPRIFALEKAAQTAAMQADHFRTLFEAAQRQLAVLGHQTDPRDIQLAELRQAENARRQQAELEQQQSAWIEQQRQAREVNSLADQMTEEAQALGAKYGLSHSEILDRFSAALQAGGGRNVSMEREAKLLVLARQSDELQAQAAAAQRQRSAAGRAPNGVGGGRPIPVKLQGTVDEAEALMRAEGFA